MRLTFRNAAGVIVVALCGVAFGQSTPASAPASTSPSPKIRIVLAGDSTVTDNAGWGEGFAASFNGRVQVINLSRGGRSSGSFVKEGRWEQVLDIKPDYVLVQFGHNDQPGHGSERESDPRTTYKANMTRYVDDAKAAGINIVLVTSLGRRQWGDDGKIHSTLVPNVEVVKQIAAEKHVPLIDLHARSIDLYERIGQEGTQAISPPRAPSTKPTLGNEAAQREGRYDGTHLNAKGSALIGPIVATELVRVVPALAPYLKAPANQ